MSQETAVNQNSTAEAKPDARDASRIYVASMPSGYSARPIHWPGHFNVRDAAARSASHPRPHTARDFAHTARPVEGRSGTRLSAAAVQTDVSAIEQKLRLSPDVPIQVFDLRRALDRAVSSDPANP